ncbi:MAG: metallophosphoesterase [bacterium]
MLVFVATSCSAGARNEAVLVERPAAGVGQMPLEKHATPIRPSQSVPTKPPKSRPFVVAVLSDMNSSYGSLDYHPEVAQSVRWLCDVVQPDLVLGTGDMVAGMKEGLDYPAMWASFHAVVTDPLNACGLRFAPSPGNHDAARAVRFQGERDEYVRQWTDRKPDVRFLDDQSWPLRYAFQPDVRANAPRFVSLDLTTPRKLSSDDLAWLDSVLEQPGGPAIVYGHVPIVPIAHGREDESSNDVALAQTLVKHGVALFLHGHHHAYYPHKAGGVPTISMPNLGSGARAWIGTRDIGGPGLVLLTIDGTQVSWQAYHAPTFSQWDVSELPLMLPTDGGDVELWQPPITKTPTQTVP